MWVLLVIYANHAESINAFIAAFVFVLSFINYIGDRFLFVFRIVDAYHTFFKDTLIVDVVAYITAENLRDAMLIFNAHKVASDEL